MSWFILFLAGLFEVVWAIGLKYSEGFTKLTPSIITLVTMIISFYLLSLALKSLPLGTAYAVWVGIGTIGTVIAGIFLFGESMNIIRVISILFILLGIIGLKLTTN
ncbi:quaternary ammonium compound efflux SMR transporter SugE [Aliarcobacter vitoriensis]|uniref:Guanidinium exporter n=1 Tax=Aliarcobacter vitoriensis TaxID=2011099 RepID=A0A366MRH4_9BACT|nr:quaternary ammonium compound efflux SMR transporter SugE [Aliarcobacter vitoriensis]RBQ28079.1 quaternary ammonium compound-resistance protein SugE [Aliarcobacter vitoriensis]